jgi:hypothetical protein
VLSVATVAIVATCATACKKDDVDELQTPTGATAAVAGDAQAPRDHLADGELLESATRVFGLALPQGVTIESNMPPQVVASGEPKAADVANYLRSRVAMGSVKVGAASTMFVGVQVPSNPGHELSIRVEPRANGKGVLMTIRDITPPSIDPSLTEEQRWRQVGILPGGKIADPSHLH